MKCHSGDIFEAQMEITTQIHPPPLPQLALLISEVNEATFPLSGGWIGRESMREITFHFVSENTHYLTYKIFNLSN